MSKRDPEMSQSKKCNQWNLGMKAHIGVDVRSGLVHTAGVTTGRVHDAKVMDNLIREDDRAVFGVKGYVQELVFPVCLFLNSLFNDTTSTRAKTRRPMVRNHSGLGHPRVAAKAIWQQCVYFRHRRRRQPKQRGYSPGLLPAAAWMLGGRKPSNQNSQ